MLGFLTPGLSGPALRARACLSQSAAFGSAGSSPPSSQNAALPPRECLAAAAPATVALSAAWHPLLLLQVRTWPLDVLVAFSLSPNKTDGLAFPGGLFVLQAGRPHGVDGE